MKTPNLDSIYYSMKQERTFTVTHVNGDDIETTIGPMTLRHFDRFVIKVENN